MKRTRAVLLTAFLGFNVARGALANMVSNPGFETGDFPTWTIEGNTDAMTVTSTNVAYSSSPLIYPSYPNSGSYYAKLGPPQLNGDPNSLGDYGYVDQSIPTNSGSTYLISFYMMSVGQDDQAGGSDPMTGMPYPAFFNPNYFNASFGGASLWNSTQATDLSDTSGYDYQVQSFTATATSTATDLEFQVEDDASAGYFLVDDVSVTQVPEPASITLGALGCAYALLQRRRRHKLETAP
jgi:hypothetical protein